MIAMITHLKNLHFWRRWGFSEEEEEEQEQEQEEEEEDDDVLQYQRIYHLHIFHNTPRFSFLLGQLQLSQENWKQCLCKILGANKVYYVRCANGESKKQQETDPYVEKREKNTNIKSHFLF